MELDWLSLLEKMPDDWLWQLFSHSGVFMILQTCGGMRKILERVRPGVGMQTGMSFIDQNVQSLRTLCQRSKIIRINVTTPQLTADGIHRLCELLAHEQCLQRFELYHWNPQLEIGPNFMSVISLPTLKNLRFLGMSANADTVQCVADVLVSVNNIVELMFCYTSLGAEGVMPLAQALRSNQSVSTLNLRGNDLRDEGCDAISDILRNNVLECLIIADNRLARVRRLARELQYSRLRHLDLGNNSIGEDGAELLAGALLAHPTLLHLDLSHNVVGSRGGEAFARALRGNSTLTTLLLRGNNIQNIGGFALVAALCSLPNTNSTLKVLDVGFNGMQGLIIQGAFRGIAQNKPTLVVYI
jgi:Ran GTPase-activating protein (RanGAP) involved in mRNA processing and transport